MNYGLDKSQKLCGETTINALFSQGKSFISYPVRVVWMSKPVLKKAGVRILVSVPKKKLKHAVDRNRIKRLIREAYRLHATAIKEVAAVHGLEIQLSFIWIPDERIGYERVERKIREALSKIELLVTATTEESM